MGSTLRGGGGRRIEVIVKMQEKKSEGEKLARINGCDRRIENWPDLESAIFETCTISTLIFQSFESKSEV